jgi:hypothetical protein
MKAVVLLALLAGFSWMSAALAEESPRPGGWSLEAIPSEKLYRLSIDRETRHGGKSAGLLESQGAGYQRNHYASMMQTIDAGPYRGKRLRLTAFLKIEDVKESAGMHAIVRHPADSEDRFPKSQRLQGSADWTRYEVEFAVVDYATQIECRVELVGPGRVWVDDVTFQVVGDAGDTRIKDVGNTDLDQTQLEYDLGLMRGLWEGNAPADRNAFIRRTTLEVQGNKLIVTDYTQSGIWQQLTYDFELERSSRISLITQRSVQVTAGMAQGSAAPAGFSHSHPYTVNHRQLVEIFDVLDGNKGPPTLRQWHRVENNE